jgi:hypothetical protein
MAGNKDTSMAATPSFMQVEGQKGDVTEKAHTEVRINFGSE